jgi:S1-C subfamily serine protease
MRNNVIKTISTTVADPDSIKHTPPSYFSGMRLQNFHELASNDTVLHGVIITHVANTSNGALAGLMPGDVITAINKTPVVSLATLQTAIKGQTKPLFLQVMRGNDAVFLVLSL